ncbi:MAG TPA: hypothetical protein VH087_20200 [Thermoanaerobaculia bacterium]|jgi:hypothetical protein|nr:hypothetical protein [Thermoanaerobaculia bacterium]
MDKRELARVPIRIRESDVTRSAWRMEIDSDHGPGTITRIEHEGSILWRGDGIFLGAPQEQLAAIYDELNAPPDDEPAFELQQLG